MSVDLTNLQDKLSLKQEELNAEYAKGGTANAGTIEKLKADIDEITYQIEMDKKLAEHDERAEEEQNTVITAWDNMVIDGVPLRDLFLNDDSAGAEMAYQAVVIAGKKNDQDIVAKYMNEIKALTEQLEAEKKSKSELQTLHDQVCDESRGYRTQINNLEMEKEDLESKLANAAAQLDEANKEIERLNGHVDDLRKEIAIGAANAAKVIETGANSLEAWKAAKAAADAAKPAIYDVKPVDAKQSRFTAKLAATDEPVEFGYLEKGKYREVTAEEADVFRAEYIRQQAEAAEQVQTDDNADLSLGAGTDITVPQFQEEDQPVNGVDETNTDVALAGETVTRQEFEELKARVAQLEGTNSQGSAA